jgi:hypothetical protein
MPAAQRQQFMPAEHPIGVGPEKMIEHFGPLTVVQPHPNYLKHGMKPIRTDDIDPREFEQESVLLFEKNDHVHRVPATMGDGTPVMRKVMPRTLSMRRMFPVPVPNSNAVRLVP